jgi:hypothetical protein
VRAGLSTDGVTDVNVMVGDWHLAHVVHHASTLEASDV